MKKFTAILLTTLLAGSVMAAEKPYKAPSPAQLKTLKLPPAIELSKSKWLWSSNAANANQTPCFYRFELNISEPVKSAEMVGYMDDGGHLYCNGKFLQPRRVQEQKRQVRAFRYDFTKELKQGKNIIAADVFNDRHTGGLCMLGKIVYKSGKVQ